MLLNLSKDGGILSKDGFSASHCSPMAACAATKDWDVTAKL